MTRSPRFSVSTGASPSGAPIIVPAMKQNDCSAVMVSTPLTSAKTKAPDAA
jgi:hypothetical protein